ncbi:MAG: ECF transporter S component [Bacteroidota bacterium]|nr:ECF transporter S component [Bacteroidota bacterium]
MRWTAEDRAAALREEELRRLPLAAVFTALGVLLPQLFHALGLGAAFLPMFLPVLAAGLLLPLRLALVTATLTPLLSWLLTGMPPLSPPVLPLLLIELPVTAGAAAFLRRSLRWPVLAAAAVALLIDRLLLLAILETVTLLAGVQHPLLGPTMVVAGLPGVILHLLVLPPTLKIIETRYPHLAPQRVTELR